MWDESFDRYGRRIRSTTRPPPCRSLGRRSRTPCSSRGARGRGHVEPRTRTSCGRTRAPRTPTRRGDLHRSARAWKRGALTTCRGAIGTSRNGPADARRLGSGWSRRSARLGVCAARRHGDDRPQQWARCIASAHGRRTRRWGCDRALVASSGSCMVVGVRTNAKTFSVVRCGFFRGSGARRPWSRP